jgi:hypothetical protein
VRRAGARTAPVGNWWAGVTATAVTSLDASAATSMPCSSTGSGWVVRPPLRRVSRTPTDPGSSTPIVVTPCPVSASATSRAACANPPVTTMRSSGATTARVRPR